MDGIGDLYARKATAESNLKSAKKRTEAALKQKRSQQIHTILALGVGTVLMVLFGFKSIFLLIAIVAATGAYLVVLSAQPKGMSLIMAREQEILAAEEVARAEILINNDLLEGM